MIRHIFQLLWAKRKTNALMMLEIFLAFLVLFASVCFIIFQLKKLKYPLGFETKDHWMVSMDDFYYKDSTEAANQLDQLKNELKNCPLVESVGSSNSSAPYLNNTSTTSNDNLGFNISTRYAEVDIDFGPAMGIQITSGRWFNEQDHLSKYPPIIVNELFLKNFFPGKNMLDSIIPINGEHRIVGVMKDYRYKGKFDEPANMSLLLRRHTEKYLNFILLKMKPGTPLGEQETINNIVKNVTKSNSFVIKSLEQEESRNARSRWIPIIALLSICAFLCINISLGLFGVLWYNINKRRSEIGLRRAVGAHTSDISSQFVLETLGLAVLAILAGILFAIQVPLLKVIDIDDSIFYEAIGVVTLILIMLVLLCAFIPSRQAAAIQPARALHEE